MPINKFLLLTILLSLTHNYSYTMFRLATFQSLKSALPQQAFKHRYLLGTSALGGGALYGLYSLKKTKEQKALISYHLATKERYKSFLEKVLKEGLNPLDFNG